MAGLAVVTIVIGSNLSGLGRPGTRAGSGRGRCARRVGTGRPSLTAGVVTVHRGGEADGIVLTSTGLIATS